MSSQNGAVLRLNLYEVLALPQNSDPEKPLAHLSMYLCI
jgi:hypothetical protein